MRKQNLLKKDSDILAINSQNIDNHFIKVLKIFIKKYFFIKNL